MNDFKELAVQLYWLAAELLRRIDTDEQERAALIASVKKTPMERYFIFQA